MPGAQKSRPPIDRDVAKLIGATLRRNREQLGWDRGRLCDENARALDTTERMRLVAVLVEEYL